MLITIFAYMKNRFPRHSARTVGSPTRSLSPYAYCASVGIYPNDDTKYPQPPSSADIKYAGDGANYCFGHQIPNHIVRRKRNIILHIFKRRQKVSTA